MNKFSSWRSYHNFSHRVKMVNRYVYPEEIEHFFQAVIATSKKRRLNVKKGYIFWRAQHGFAWRTVSQDSVEYEVESPFPSKRMKPLKYSAKEGRLNPKGIPCLYLATDRETAMSEVRPWLGEYISVGQFKTNRKLQLVDCSIKNDDPNMFYFKEPGIRKREQAVWADINNGFSRPVSENETDANYAPTQILAEIFRDKGYDGVVYKSLLGKGFNIALFDLGEADIINCFLYETESVKFGFKDAANPYFVTPKKISKKGGKN